MIIIFCVGLLSFKRESPLIVQLLIIPVLTTLILVIGCGYPLFPRLFFFAIGFGALIVVRGAMELGKKITRLLHIESSKSTLIGTALCSALIIVSAISIPSVYAPKQDYKAALTWVEENIEPGDTVVTVGATTIIYQRFYGMDWENIKTLERLNEIRSQSKRVWLLYTLLATIEPKYPEIVESIKLDFKIVEQFPGTLNGGTIYVSQSYTFMS